MDIFEVTWPQWIDLWSTQPSYEAQKIVFSLFWGTNSIRCQKTSHFEKVSDSFTFIGSNRFEDVHPSCEPVDIWPAKSSPSQPSLRRLHLYFTHTTQFFGGVRGCVRSIISCIVFSFKLNLVESAALRPATSSFWICLVIVNLQMHLFKRSGASLTCTGILRLSGRG